MKRISSSIFIFIYLIIISFTANAKKEEMKLILFKGESFTYLISQENSIEGTQETAPMHQMVSLRIRHTVIGRLPSGNYEMEAVYLGFSTKFKNQGRKFSYNTDTVDVRNKLYKVLNFLNGVTLSYEVSPEGEVSNIRGFEVVQNRTDSDPFLKGMLWSFGNTQFLSEFFNYVPHKSVGIGSKWTNSSEMVELKNYKYDIQYTYLAKTEKEIKLDRETSFNYATEIAVNDSTVNHITQAITQEGNICISPKNMMPISSDMVQKIQLTAYHERPSVSKKIDPILLTTKTKMIRVKN